MNLLEAAKAAVEKAFSDGIEARVGVLCANLASGTAEASCEQMFRNAVEELERARAIALRVVGEVLS